MALGRRRRRDRRPAGAGGEVVVLGVPERRCACCWKLAVQWCSGHARRLIHVRKGPGLALAAVRVPDVGRGVGRGGVHRVVRRLEQLVEAGAVKGGARWARVYAVSVVPALLLGWQSC